MPHNKQHSGGHTVRQMVSYPRRAVNTAATKLSAGPKEFKRRRKANPGKYLTEKELDAYRPRNK